MQITKIRVTILKNSRTNAKAYADVTIDETIQLKSMMISDGKYGLFVKQPERFVKGVTKDQDKSYPYYYIEKAFKDEIQKLVLEEYEKQINSGEFPEAGEDDLPF